MASRSTFVFKRVFDEVDRCLDRGGGWNDTTKTCEDAAPDTRRPDALVNGSSVMRTPEPRF